MSIPRWIFGECARLGFVKRPYGSIFLEWNKSVNPACMIYKLILLDRKRQKRQKGRISK